MNHVSSSSVNRKPRVLFVCTGNTCRSVLAEYIARKKFGGRISVSSAGLLPGSKEDAENAIFTLKSLFGVDASNHESRNVRTVDIDTFDLVVTLDSEVATELQTLFPGLPVERLVKWKIKDPYGDDPSEYPLCAKNIYAQLKRLPILGG